MSTQVKLLPAFIMLLAGAVTSIITYCVGYSSKSALIILLIVLLIFYILGVVLQKLIVKFETANEEKERERAKAEAEAEANNAEGKVVEKDESEINKNTDSQGGGVGNRPEL